MKITDIITGKRPSLSFEVFPPKSSTAYASVADAAREIAALRPGYMSVTYGAGGTTDLYTVDICEKIAAAGVTPLAHLSCITATRESIDRSIASLKSRGIENVLALRGDYPKEEGAVIPADRPYRYASDLAERLREEGFCIGGACYPEGHPESPDGRVDIEMLKIKVESGVSFLTTQMFFDNNVIYNFMYRLYRAGITVPVVPGIMPVTSAAQVKRIAAISGGSLPQKFLRLVDRYGEDGESMRAAGIAYATSQIVDLYANGFNAVHVYSMNKPQVARAIKENLAPILG